MSSRISVVSDLVVAVVARDTMRTAETKDVPNDDTYARHQERLFSLLYRAFLEAFKGEIIPSDAKLDTVQVVKTLLQHSQEEHPQQDLSHDAGSSDSNIIFCLFTAVLTSVRGVESNCIFGVLYEV